jgi:hypothetical protein
MPTRIEIDCSTGIEAVIELSPTEIADLEQLKVEAEARQTQEANALAARVSAKASAEAKLAALGLTAEEIAAL